ncbi:MAG: glutamate 5-kinase [Anaerolineae bacterium]|jgi:glutamate 5-kinase|nr:glutamate 5-kinase [Anaerolineae bacterium]MCZ7551308.1 glutamate 5-kinase [Anaerolineales bacterium]
MPSSKLPSLIGRRIVVKLGTSTLTDGTANLSQARMVDLVRQFSLLRTAGAELILVSSGAIALGREVLDFPNLPRDVPAKQMLAAVGQPRLIDLWGRLFAIYNLTIAQVLLTRDDLRLRSRYLNARNTLQALLQQGLIPIINENDTVATEEIRVGDNDNLSALVANLIDASQLVLLTDREGFFTADPGKNPNAQLVSLVDTAEIGSELWEAAGGSGSLGTGGMVTKLQSADLARRSGAEVVIARGKTPDILVRLMQGEMLGTRFTPTLSAMESRKRYILTGGMGGRLIVDQGAVAALHQGGSLLPAGLVDVLGEFDRGETLSVCDPQGREIARGLVNYNHQDCLKICRRQSHEIEALLGYFFGEEIIHRKNMVLIQTEAR